VASTFSVFLFLPPAASCYAASRACLAPGGRGGVSVFQILYQTL